MSVDRHRHTYESNNWNDKDLSKRQEFGAMESDDTDNDRFIDKVNKTNQQTSQKYARFVRKSTKA